MSGNLEALTEALKDKFVVKVIISIFFIASGTLISILGIVGNISSYILLSDFSRIVLFIYGIILAIMGFFLIKLIDMEWVVRWIREIDIRKEEAEEVTKKLESQLEITRLFISSMLPRWELEVLYKIYGNERYMHDTSMSNQSDFRRDLGDLWGRGFIRQKQGEYLPWG